MAETKQDLPSREYDKKYRYFADVRHGMFIFITKGDTDWPPEGYPVVELSEFDVKQFINGGD